MSMGAMLLLGLCFVVGKAVYRQLTAVDMGLPHHTEWQVYRSDDGGYAARFPGEPELSRQQSPLPGGPVEIQTLTYATKRGGFSTSFVDYPEAVVEDRELASIIDDVVEGMAEGVSGRLVTETPLEFEAFPGRDVLIAGDGYTVRARVILAQRRLFMIQAVTAVRLDEKTLDAFFESFRFTN